MCWMGSREQSCLQARRWCCTLGESLSMLSLIMPSIRTVDTRDMTPGAVPSVYAPVVAMVAARAMERSMLMSFVAF